MVERQLKLRSRKCDVLPVKVGLGWNLLHVVLAVKLHGRRALKDYSRSPSVKNASVCSFVVERRLAQCDKNKSDLAAKSAKLSFKEKWLLHFGVVREHQAGCPDGRLSVNLRTGPEELCADANVLAD
jgi:hypothetical protein